MNSMDSIIPTSVIGSYAWPSWLSCGIDAARRGAFGPTDLAEMLEDAVDTALHDQEEAGVDIVTDGEMRRSGFFTAEFYSHLTGVRAVEPRRKSGRAAHDQQHQFEVLEPIAAPHGLGVVQVLYARGRTRRPLKVTLPGPFTLSGRLIGGTVYPTRSDAAWAFVPIPTPSCTGWSRPARSSFRSTTPHRRSIPTWPVSFRTLQCGGRGHLGTTGCPSVLRQLRRQAAGPAQLRTGAGRDAGVAGWTNWRWNTQIGNPPNFHC